MFKETGWFSEFLWVGEGRAGTRARSESVLGSHWCLLGECAPTLSTREKTRSKCVISHVIPLKCPSASGLDWPAHARVLHLGIPWWGESLNQGRNVSKVMWLSALSFLSPLVRVSPGYLRAARDCRKGVSILIARVLYLHVNYFMSFTAALWWRYNRIFLLWSKILKYREVRWPAHGTNKSYNWLEFRYSFSPTSFQSAERCGTSSFWFLKFLW